GWAYLTVRDDGIGIPAGDLPHVFERFRRAENVTGRIAGTGIGLAAARQIVEQHGGTIAVESVEGFGTTVTIWLPLASADHAASVRASPFPWARPGTARALTSRSSPKGPPPSSSASSTGRTSGSASASPYASGPP